MDDLSKSLQKVADDFRRGIGFGDIGEVCETAATRLTALEAENAELRENFTALNRALVGDTGLSAITEAGRIKAENAKLREALPSGAIENGRETMRRIEEWYNFQCEAGPLQTCGEWLDLKRCLAAITEHTAALSQIDKHPGTD